VRLQTCVLFQPIEKLLEHILHHLSPHLYSTALLGFARFKDFSFYYSSACIFFFFFKKKAGEGGSNSWLHFIAGWGEVMARLKLMEKLLLTVVNLSFPSGICF